jgi:iron-sulfur cluster assembly protein
MISITPKAIKKAISLAQKEGKAPVLRVGVQGGGCSGLSYVLDFTDLPGSDDEVLAIEGLTVVCDPKSLKFVAGMTLDFDSNLLNGGFRFNNPKAKRSCSCGESFSI